MLRYGQEIYSVRTQVYGRGNVTHFHEFIFRKFTGFRGARAILARSVGIIIGHDEARRCIETAWTETKWISAQ